MEQADCNGLRVKPDPSDETENRVKSANVAKWPLSEMTIMRIKTEDGLVGERSSCSPLNDSQRDSLNLEIENQADRNSDETENFEEITSAAEFLSCEVTVAKEEIELKDDSDGLAEENSYSSPFDDSENDLQESEQEDTNASQLILNIFIHSFFTCQFTVWMM